MLPQALRGVQKISSSTGYLYSCSFYQESLLVTEPLRPVLSQHAGDGDVTPPLSVSAGELNLLCLSLIKVSLEKNHEPR
ncbi:MAG: hypothetical protein ACI9SB_000275 [Candidatus Azotimanducaceae bacterium]|jgi:hypothetical protein